MNIFEPGAQYRDNALCKHASNFMCGPHFCSMKITQDVREYAAQKEIDEQAVLDVGLKEKAEEFVSAGGEIYRATNT